MAVEKDSELWVVSRCLLGECCRYDGRSKRDERVLAFLKGVGARIVGVCPEMECGLGCPRPPMHVRLTAAGVELPDVNGGEHSGQMRAWLPRKLSELQALAPTGFLLKARSPSCGHGDVPVEGASQLGDGLFAAQIGAQFVGVPLWNEEQAALVCRVEDSARELLASSPACHDWDHTLRVRNNARRLWSMTLKQQRGVVGDRLVVETAALLHDIGRPQELADRGQSNHAVTGAAMVLELLPQLGVTDTAFIQHVADCVRSHRYRQREGNLPPGSLEAQIVYDADKLDGIGAIGIGRSFHFAGRVGARVHNRAAEALGSDSYSQEDSAYREYLVKLQYIRERMLTEAGRQLAERRHEFMVGFFAELNRECFGEAQEGADGR